MEPKEIKRLYDLIVLGCFGDDEEGLQERVKIVAALEKELDTDFKDTEDFHHKIRMYLATEGSPGKRLREKRKQMNLSLAGLGAILGVSRQYVHQMEIERKPLTEKALSFIVAERCQPVQGIGLVAEKG